MGAVNEPNCITSTLLTLLVIPSFYDSIEKAREGALAKLRRRDARWNTPVAVVLTGLEVLATLTLLRFVWRQLARAFGWVRGRGRRAQPA